MYTRILVPLDGSERAEKAIPTAARIARATHASIVLLNAISVPPEYGTAYVPATFSATDFDLMRRQAVEYLDSIAARPVLAGVTTQNEVVVAPAALAILDTITADDIDLVVMTSHGRTGVTRWVLGSVAQHVSRTATVPVLILREHVEGEVGKHPDLEHLTRVLVPLDGSELAEAAIEPAADVASALATPGEAAIHLSLVVSPYEANQENVPSAFAVTGAKDYLKGIVDRLRGQYPHLTVTYSVGVGLDIAGTLIRIAESGEDVEGAGVFGGCDFIAMATHGRTGLARWVIGSITDRVLHGTRLPMLIVRPRAVRAKKSPADEQTKRENEPQIWSALY